MIWAKSAFLGIRFVLGLLFAFGAFSAFATVLGQYSREGNFDSRAALMMAVLGALSAWLWPSNAERSAIASQTDGRTPPKWLLPMLTGAATTALLAAGVLAALLSAASSEQTGLESENTILEAESRAYERAAEQLAELFCAVAVPDPDPQCATDLVQAALQP